MKLNETVKMMNSESYEERSKAEYYQLENRRESLKTMLEMYQAGTLPFTPKCSYELLTDQFIAMTYYQRALVARATIEGIEL